MERRDFFKKLGAVTATLSMPYILPSGRLFASTGSRLANHVVFCLFAGGVRNLEAVHKAEGNLVPHLMNGNESISSDIAHSIDSMPNLSQAPLQQFGTLFKEFRYAQGPPGHFNGHLTAVTGQYTDETLSLRDRSDMPTIFELYRKHSSPSKSALNAWWLTQHNNLIPILNYSNHPDYGIQYAANQMSLPFLVRGAQFDKVDKLRMFFEEDWDGVDQLSSFMNQSFSSGSLSIPHDAINNMEDARQIQGFISQLIRNKKDGLYETPWNVSDPTTDMYNLFYAGEVIKSFQPELLVVNLMNIDIGHSNFTQYCNNLHKASYGVAKLWQTIQSTPGMADDTVLIIVPEVGRNAQSNPLRDENGRYALDHTMDDPIAREMFAMVLGPPSVVHQGQVIDQVVGQSIDVVPTIARILGFDTDMPSWMLPGRALEEAFI